MQQTTSPSKLDTTYTQPPFFILSSPWLSGPFSVSYPWLPWIKMQHINSEISIISRGQWWEARYHIKKQRHYFANKGLSHQGYGFSSSHVWMWESDYKESWGPKNWCFWTVVLEKTLESPLDCKEIQLVNPKGDQSWVFIGRTDVEAETPILWPPDA